MKHTEISGCLGRYKEVINTLKKRRGMETQQLIAEKMLYKRGETISEYGNAKNFKEPKFREFVGLLCKVFNVNPHFIFEAKGPMFLVREEELASLETVSREIPLDLQIQSIEYAITVLDAQLKTLRAGMPDDKTGLS